MCCRINESPSLGCIQNIQIVDGWRLFLVVNLTRAEHTCRGSIYVLFFWIGSFECEDPPEIWIIEGWKTPPWWGIHFLKAAHIKPHGRRELCFLSVSVPSFVLANLPALLLRHSFAGVRRYIFRIWHRLKSNSSLEFQAQTGTVDTFRHTRWTTIRFLTFPAGDIYLWDSWNYNL